MTRKTALITFLCILVAIVLLGLLLFQNRLTQFDANLYATMTALR